MLICVFSSVTGWIVRLLIKCFLIPWGIKSSLLYIIILEKRIHAYLCQNECRILFGTWEENKTAKPILIITWSKDNFIKLSCLVNVNLWPIYSFTSNYCKHNYEKRIAHLLIDLQCDPLWLEIWICVGRMHIVPIFTWVESKLLIKDDKYI
jgi:hypothetical protein